MQATGKVGREILPKPWLCPRPSNCPLTVRNIFIHSSINSFIHSLEQETHIECILCTRHKPVAMDNTQTLPPGLTHQCKQGIILINHKYFPGLPQLTRQAHQHIVNAVFQIIAPHAVCGDDQRFSFPLSHRQLCGPTCMTRMASTTCNLPETSTSPKLVCILFSEIRLFRFSLNVMAMSTCHKFPNLLSVSFLIYQTNHSQKSLL